MGILDTDAAAIFADPLMSVSVRYGVQVTRGFLDNSTAVFDAGGQPAQVAAITVLIQSSSLTGLAEDAAIEVDGTDYVIRSIVRQDDGRTTNILLAAED